MGVDKWRRGTGTSPGVFANESSPSTPHRGHLLRQREAEGGWSARIKVLAPSTLGQADKDGGGRTIALTEEEFRKSGFRGRELIAVLAGPSRLIVGRVVSLPSAALRAGNVGLASTSLHSLGCEEGARVRVRRMVDTAINVIAADYVLLELECGPGRIQESHAYLADFSKSRRALLNCAAGFTTRGCHIRQGDLLSVSFEGLPHRFRVMQVAPPQDPQCGASRRDTRRDAEEGGVGVDAFVGSFASLAIDNEREAPSKFGSSLSTLHDHVVQHETPRTGRTKVGGVEDNHEENRNVGDPAERNTARERLEAFYSEYNPEKLDDVPGILAKYANREDELFANIERKYGPCTVPPVGKKHEQSTSLRLKVTPDQRVLNSVDQGSLKGDVTSFEADGGVTEHAMQATRTGRTERASEEVDKENGNSVDRLTKSNVFHSRLEAFYREHNPEKLGDVPGILAKYEGREDNLFAKLEQKYGPSSYRAAASGGDVGTERKRQCHVAKPESPATTNCVVRPSIKPEAVIRTPTPSKSQSLRQRLTNPDSLERARICEWGTNEVVWSVSADTYLELKAADTPSVDLSREQAERGTRGGERHAPMSAEPFDIITPGKDFVRERDEWSSVGGLSAQIDQLKEAIQLPLQAPEVLRRYGVRPPRGVLLHGPPGTGKTTLARAAAAACGCHVIVVNGSELMSRFVGESEGALRRTFAEASLKAPCLIVFDEVDTLCPRRDEASSEAQRRVVSTMLALLDGVDAKEQVMVIACTNRPQAIDPALRRPGRFDSEIEIGVPDEAGRAEILSVLLRSVPHSMEDTDTASDQKLGGSDRRCSGIKEIAARTHGFVGADLQLLLKEAALQALRRTRGGGLGYFTDSSGGGDQTNAARQSRTTGTSDEMHSSQAQGILPVLTIEDFLAALPLVSPSGLREVAVEVPSVRWGDIGGMEAVKQSLREVVEWPLRHPEAFERMGMSPPRGVLLYGPPGCSKTLMARALATESGMNFLAVKGPELLSKWLGESERAMQGLFKRARSAAPTIIFFDEVDALASSRGAEGVAGATERVLTQLLTELDGIQPLKRVVVVAATNRPDVIDPALLRPGRLDRLVYVPPPDMPSRREILRLSLAKVPAAAEVDREDLARRTEGFSGAEVVALCREAAICALEEDLSSTQIRQSHLLQALEQTRPQITPEVLALYSRFHGRNPPRF